MRFVFWLAPLLALNTCNWAPEARAADGQTLQGFTSSDFYKGLVSRAIAHLPSQVLRRCPTLASGMSTFTSIKPVTFGTDGFPNGGLWRHQLSMHGCGEEVTLNLYFTASTDEKVDTIIANPGSSIADPTLQRDALFIALTGLAASGKTCRTALVKTTKFESYGLLFPPTPDPREGQRRPWWETWTLVGCDHTYDVPLDFVPDATGTQVTQPGHIAEH